VAAWVWVLIAVVIVVIGALVFRSEPQASLGRTAPTIRIRI